MGGFHFLGDFPHGFPVPGSCQGAEELVEFSGGRVVQRVLGANPVEEPEGLGTAVAAVAEDAVDELRVDNRGG